MLDCLDEKKLKNITQEEFDEMIEEHEGNMSLYLCGYNLSNLKIESKDLEKVLIQCCLLNNVIFKNCNLKDNNILCSKIINTSFIKCNFSNGYLCDCEFINSDLSSCYIKGCNLDKSILINTKMPNFLMICPSQGSFIGYKKVCDINNYHKKYILKLEIPRDAKRISTISLKCRCDKAKILEIQNLNGRIVKRVTKVRSIYNCHFIYELDKTVEEPNFDECRWHECVPGIHFFINRKDAKSY